MLGVVVSALLTRILSKSQVGDYLSAATMAFLGGAIAQLGLDRATVRFVASAMGVGQPGRAHAAIRMALRYGTIGALVVAAVIALGFGRFIADQVFDSPQLASMMPVIAGWVVTLALQGLFVESFRGCSASAPRRCWTRSSRTRRRRSRSGSSGSCEPT